MVFVIYEANTLRVINRVDDKEQAKKLCSEHNHPLRDKTQEELREMDAHKWFWKEE